MDGLGGEEHAIELLIDDPFTGVPDAAARSAELVFLHDVVESAAQSCIEGLIVVRREEQGDLRDLVCLNTMRVLIYS